MKNKLMACIAVLAVLGMVFVGASAIEDEQDAAGSAVAENKLIIYSNIPGSAITWESNQVFTLPNPDPLFKWEGHEFYCYSHSTTYTGEKLMPGDVLSVKGLVKLYCIWDVDESASQDDDKPSEGKEDTKPSEGGDDTKPSEGGDNTKPSEGGDDTKPSEGGDDTKPSEGQGESSTAPAQDNTLIICAIVVIIALIVVVAFVLHKHH